MQVVEITCRKLNLAETVKQNKEVYDTSIAKHIVASTKSRNNLLDEYQANNMPVAKEEHTDLFIDKSKTLSAIAESVYEQIEETEIAVMVLAHIEKVLDGGCLFEKPKA